jgi:hypothetical protein
MPRTISGTAFGSEGGQTKEWAEAFERTKPKANDGPLSVARGAIYMLNFRLDIYAWIPQPDLVNPIFALPGGVSRWGQGACGPRFGGDFFVMPPVGYSWSNTYRAMQTFEFRANDLGSPPLVMSNAGVKPGLTTVLTAPRAAGGRVCYSQVPTITASKAAVNWNAADGYYEVQMHGAAHDPVPSTAASTVLGSFGGAAGSALTPDLEWNLTIRFQRGLKIPNLLRARYTFSGAMSLDVSKSKFSAGFNGFQNLIHGVIMVRRFPSYVVYATLDSGRSIPITIPIYFADASQRSLAEIVVGQHDPIRQLTW